MHLVAPNAYKKPRWVHVAYAADAVIGCEDFRLGIIFAGNAIRYTDRFVALWCVLLLRPVWVAVTAPREAEVELCCTGGWAHRCDGCVFLRLCLNLRANCTVCVKKKSRDDLITLYYMTVRNVFCFVFPPNCEFERSTIICDTIFVGMFPWPEYVDFSQSLGRWECAGDDVRWEMVVMVTSRWRARMGADQEGSNRWVNAGGVARCFTA